MSDVAIITGGARNIGRAVALSAARHGYHVAIFDRLSADETAAMIVGAGGHAKAYRLDLSDQEAVVSAVTDVESSMGPIHLLANNAGGGDPVGRFANASADHWWTQFADNVRPTFLCTHAVLPGMIARNGGCIVNTVSRFATVPATGGPSAYGAAKAAILRLTEDLAFEMRGIGVSLFALHPGGVRPAPGTYLTEPPPGMTSAQLDMLLSHLSDPPELAADMTMRLASGCADRLSGRFIDATEDLDAVIAKCDDIIASDGRFLRINGVTHL
jgi:NAD(P)-dependent dehydrogenase (short-subunit alcohol dehydrogenase family)